MTKIPINRRQMKYVATVSLALIVVISLLPFGIALACPSAPPDSNPSL
jgi:hypothetical protein